MKVNDEGYRAIQAKARIRLEGGQKPESIECADEPSSGVAKQEAPLKEIIGEEKDMTETAVQAEKKSDGKRGICKTEGCEKARLKDGLCYRCWKAANGGKEPYPFKPKKPKVVRGTLFAPGLGARVKAVRDWAGFSSIKQWGSLLKSDNSAIGDIEREGSRVKDEGKTKLIDRICATYPNIRREWLTMGTGEMIAAGETKGGECETKGVENERTFPVSEFEESNKVAATIDACRNLLEEKLSGNINPVITLARKVEEKYAIVDGPRSAEIFFRAGNDGGGIMVFDKCETVLVMDEKGPTDKKEATYEDWIFLRDVGNQIERLQMELAE
jgi:hypothetical protein